MGLLQNVSLLNAEPLRYVPGGAAVQCANRFSFTRPEAKANKSIGSWSFARFSGYPDGYSMPYAFEIPIQGGGMSSRNSANGAGTIPASLMRSIKTIASKTVPKMGSGTVSSAALSVLIQMFADIVGGGEIADSDLKNILNMAITLNGSGEVSDTTLLAILAWMNATITGSGTLDDSVMKGWADMAASIVVTGDLVTAKSCAQAVWDELVADHQDVGSTGKALNDAGAAGNPWSADADTNNDPGTMGEKVNKIKKDTGLIPAIL